MRNHRVWLTSLVLVILGAAAALAGESVTGKWQLTIELSDGQGGSAAFEFEQADDGTLTGSYDGALGQQDIAGKVSGETIEFSFDSDAGSVSYSGKVEGDKMSGECTYGSLGRGTFQGERSK